MAPRPRDAIARVLSRVHPSLITLALLALVALGVEGGLRLWSAPEGPRWNPEIPSDPELLWANPPGPLRGLGVETTINAQGMRAHEVPASKPEGTRRLVLTGDSSVFGVMVRDHEVVSAALERRLGPGYEVYNGGTPGYSSEQSLRQVRRTLEAVRPDLLVVANLWSDNNFDAFVDAQALARIDSSRYRWGLRLGRVLHHSALASAVLGLRDHREREIGWGLMRQDAVLGVRRVDLHRYTDNLEAFVSTGSAVGARTAFVMLANTEDLTRPERSWPWDPYREVMRDAALRHQVPLVDLPAVFRASGRSPEELFLDDMHPSAAGHALMAEAVAGALEAWGWTRGRHPPPPENAGPPRPVHDAWVHPWEEGLPRVPTIAGVITSSRRDMRAEIEAVAGPPPGVVVDRVSLPGPAPFALVVEPPGTVWLRVRTRPRNGEGEEQVVSLEDQPLSVDHPAWGVLVDLDERRVDAP